MQASAPSRQKTVSYIFPVAPEENPKENSRDHQNPDIGDRTHLIAEAKFMLISRRTRHEFLESSLFREPGWDMLLALYMTEESEARNSITRLTEFSGVPATTALRWIDHLGRSGLTRRVPHPTDDRAAFIELTDKGRYSLDGYFGRAGAM